MVKNTSSQKMNISWERLVLEKDNNTRVTKDSYSLNPGEGTKWDSDFGMYVQNITYLLSGEKTSANSGNLSYLLNAPATNYYSPYLYSKIKRPTYYKDDVHLQESCTCDKARFSDTISSDPICDECSHYKFCHPAFRDMYN